jgi:Cys-tRNA(Pro)/Cys-tRNA(Cys) deacylase
MKANNVTRLLSAKGIPFEVIELPVEKLGALEAAQLIGAPPEQVFKTIVVTRQGIGKPVLAVVPGSREVDLKALAQVLGEKKVLLPAERQAERLTGLQAGGISPLALLNRGFQIVVDDSIERFERVYISGGQRGMNILMPASSLILLTGAKVAKIT